MLAYLGSKLVKTLIQPAPNLAVILDTFQELGWPPKIDDPIPPAGFSGSASQRLADAVRGLNSGQETIKFEKDGDGVTWQLAGEAS